MVQVVFRDAAQLQNARQLVSERLQQLRTQLPASADSPDISPPLSPLGTVLQYASPCLIRRQQMSNCDCAHWFKPPTRTLCLPFLALPR